MVAPNGARKIKKDHPLYPKVKDGRAKAAKAVVFNKKSNLILIFNYKFKYILKNQ